MINYLVESTHLEEIAELAGWDSHDLENHLILQHPRETQEGYQERINLVRVYIQLMLLEKKSQNITIDELRKRTRQLKNDVAHYKKIYGPNWEDDPNKH